MTDIENSSAVTDTATGIASDARMSDHANNGHHEPSTHEAEILEHNSPIGQPALPDGTAPGATPERVTDTNPNTVPATGTVQVKDKRSIRRPALRDGRMSSGSSAIRSNFTIIDPKRKLGGGYSSEERAELERLYGTALS